MVDAKRKGAQAQRIFEKPEMDRERKEKIVAENKHSVIELAENT
jgi:hypothetical protein